MPREAASEYAKAFKVTVSWLLNLPGPGENPPALAPDVEKIEVGQLEPQQVKVLSAAMAGLNAEVWRITSDMMAGANYLPGDFVVVDLGARPRPQNFVLAESAGVPIIRQYVPTNLWSFHLSGSNPPTPVDNVRTIIRGVIVSKLSI